MKRNPQTKPYLSVCLIVRNCELTLPGSLEACLKSVRAVAPDAEIVIVDTMSKDNTVEIAMRYADVFAEFKGPNGDWTKETRFDAPGNPPWDAAAARNKSFELAHGRWKMWIDSDDVLLYEESAEEILKLNGRWKPESGGAAQKVFETPDRKSIPLIDLLYKVERETPAIKVFYAPYLYRTGGDGLAIEWQDRERIIRDDADFVWKSKGHEVCVPRLEGVHTMVVFLPHLLFQHMKKFTDEDSRFSLERHWNTLIKGYEDGTDRSTRTCLYLANFAANGIAPERVDEFLDQAYESATIPLDRYRVHLDRAKVRARNGFTTDAYEHIAIAIAIRPDLPDAYVVGFQLANEVEDWPRAAEWAEKASECRPAQPDSLIPPRLSRNSAIAYAAQANWRFAKKLEEVAQFDRALTHLEKAKTLAEKLSRDPRVGGDSEEAILLANFFGNEYVALKFTLTLTELHRFLEANDETQKAALIDNVIPHQYAHSSIASGLQKRSEKVIRHALDPVSYEEFYENDETNGAVAACEEMIRMPIEKQLWRVQYMAARIAEYIRASPHPVTILDYGCFDGVTSIAMLCAIPLDKVERYVGIEIQPDAIERFKRRINEIPKLEPLRAKGKTVFLMGSQPMIAEALSSNGGKFDIVICGEVIEHVPSASVFAAQLHDASKGIVVLSTPHGCYDNGVPPTSTHYGKERDTRGHLRAMLPRDLAEALRASGRVLDMRSCVVLANKAAELAAVSVPVRHEYEASVRPSPVTFVVPAALWDWNASHVYKTGIGASEETIVFLGRELAKHPRQQVEVYGPIPTEAQMICEETVDAVSYWPLAQLNKIDRKSKVVVSRSPTFGVSLEQEIGDQSKILWLQDAYYGDLNPGVAARYDKIVVVSGWHAEAMNARHGVPLDKMEVCYNFLLREHFLPAERPARQPHRFIWSSSPDRGLLTILTMWPRIRALWPDAELHVFYGWEGCKKLAAVNPQWTVMYRKLWREWQRLKNQPGVVDHGRVNHEQIALEMLKSDVWFYPSVAPGHTFEETGCANAVKAQAAGCIPVCHPVAALPETGRCGEGLMIPAWGKNEDESDYFSRCIYTIGEAFTVPESARQTMAKRAIDRFSIEAVMPKWLKLLK